MLAPSQTTLPRDHYRTGYARSRQSEGQMFPSGASKEGPLRLGKVGWDCDFYSLSGDNDKNFNVYEK